MGQVGRTVVVGVWLLLILPPQFALVVEYLSGRLNAAESVTVATELGLAAAWVVFLLSRHPRLSRR